MLFRFEELDPQAHSSAPNPPAQLLSANVALQGANNAHLALECLCGVYKVA